MSTERIFLWDNIKFILMFFVVVGHCLCTYLESGTFEAWGNYLWIITLTYTMPLFCMVSGFFYKERSLSWLLRCYLWPCLLFSAVNFIVGYLVHYPKYYWVSMKYIIEKFPAMYAMWFLWALFVWGLITPFLRKLGSYKMLLIISLVVAAISSFWGTRYLRISHLIGFYPYYLVGIILGEHSDQVYRFNSLFKKKSVIVFCTATFVYFLANHFFPGLAVASDSSAVYSFTKWGIFVKVFSYVINPVLAISFIGIIPNKELIISKYGAKTMNCYCWHMTLIFLICWGIGASFRCEWYGYVLNMVMVPLLSFLLYSKPIDRFTRFLLFK